MDKYAHLHDGELGSNSNFSNPWMCWDGCCNW